MSRIRTLSSKQSNTLEAQTRWLDQNLVEAFVQASTTAFRLSYGPGFWVERYGNTALLYVRPEVPLTQILADLREWMKTVAWKPSRIFCRQLVRSPGEKDTPILLEGDPSASTTEVVMEDGLRFEVVFHSGYNPGLFCDQRANRAYLRELQPLRLLNTFAHTCAFSVAAAMVGAETTSVDISKSFLQRGRRNFELNSLPLDQHRFVAEDVPTYLRRLAKRSEAFDAISLDPPTFGRGGSGKTFRVEREFAALLADALQLARPGAAILLSTNFSEWDADRLAKDALRLAPAATIKKIPPPADFATAPRSATIWIHV
jgi:23S rRNA (cytosine1962-C5)-methyltransferase